MCHFFFRHASEEFQFKLDEVRLELESERGLTLELKDRLMASETLAKKLESAREEEMTETAGKLEEQEELNRRLAQELEETKAALAASEQNKSINRSASFRLII